MCHKIFKPIILLFSFFIFPNVINAQTASPWDIQDIRDLVKKEDFESVSKFLEAKGYGILKWNLNYDHGSYYVIAEIQCQKEQRLIRSTQNDWLNIQNNEKLTIEFYEYEDSKILKISDDYISENNEFFKFYYTTFSWNWTYVKFGNLDNGYQLGKIGSRGEIGNSLKKVPIDSIKLDLPKQQKYGIGQYPIPKYKYVQFRNDNQNLGVLRNYSLYLGAPWPKSEYNNLHSEDTVYSFHFEMEECYPKFLSNTNSQTESKTETIQLIKSGKIYFIYISIGTKKKKYVLDSGASDFTIDESTYNQLFENGIINIKHMLPDGDYRIADGSVKTYRRTIIPEIIIGNIKVENITAIIVPDGQPLLLGKSVLDKFKTWKINNTKDIIVLETN